MLATTLTIVVSSQNSLTNTVSEFSLKDYQTAGIELVLNKISHAFNTRVCTEVGTVNYKHLLVKKFPSDDVDWVELVGRTPAQNSSLALYFPAISFTNATVEHVVNEVVNCVSNYVWRYESATDTFYIHPATNSFIMMKTGPIHVTNMTLQAFFEDNDVLKLRDHGIGFYKRKEFWGVWENKNVSLDFNESCVWEILDEISAQIPILNSWTISSYYDKTNGPTKSLYFK